ncbi:MAG: SMP-30/gluconolactonase/LRE family protein [Cytophagales bacterium]|nr:MAG: SMP-30/gluconolactonase/LRE family protein [Cytophagales bacterium]
MKLFTKLCVPISQLFCAICLLACVGANKQNTSNELYKSAFFSQPKSFTSGAEGPATDKDGNFYAVNFQKQGTIGKISADGKGEIFVELPNGSVGNGIRFNSKGEMFVADYVNHNILKINLQTKEVSVFAHADQMNQPNDLTIAKNDLIFASDPSWKNGTGQVWRIDTNGKATLLESNMGTTNGITVSPDSKKLYVNESVQRNIWVYDLSPQGEISNKKLFIDFPDFGLDGMKCDKAGNLYITRFDKGTIVKVSTDGKILKEITLSGKRPTNITFGGKNNKTCYVTLMDLGAVEKFEIE